MHTLRLCLASKYHPDRHCVFLSNSKIPTSTPLTGDLQRHFQLWINGCGETARNFEVRVKDHNDINKQSQPTKHIKDHSFSFSWDVLATVCS